MVVEAKRKSLVEQVGETLREQITAGTYQPGDRLPSEARMTQEFGVSRTVIREAVASLRADRLVEAQKGAGVFVCEPSQANAVPFGSIDPKRLSSMIEMLELRAAIEIEGAALAAHRKSPAQEEKIVTALRHFLSTTGQKAPNQEADYQLHMAIADATNNPRFSELLRILGAQMIPRLALEMEEPEADPDYTGLLVKEHSDIVTAVLDGDEDAAREAMRSHLRGCQRRYRRLLRG